MENETQPGQEPGTQADPSANANPAAPADATTTPKPQAGEGEEFDAERAMATIKNLRELEKRLTSENKKLAEKAKTYEDAQLSDAEKKDKRLGELEAENTTLRSRSQAIALTYEARLAAHELGIVDPDAAVKLADWDTVEYGEDGKPTNARSILEALVAAKPYLVKPAGAPEAPKPAPRPGAPQPGGTANPGRGTVPGQGGAPTFTESQIADRKFYEANREAIFLAMRQGRVVPG